VNLLNLTPDEAQRHIFAWVAERGEAAYRARQIFPRLWARPVSTWADITELPRRLIEDLEEAVAIPRLHLETRQSSTDGTVKFLWRLDDGFFVESVWIPEGRRRTLCISSQAGCAFGCVFCATGRMGFQRHLEPWEITGQVRELLLDPEFGKPTNVVFMGMGEPLHNWDAVDTALTILNASGGIGLGARHITVSTVGIVPKLAKLAARPEQFRLAISLHAALSERRAALMPVERKYPVDQLTAALSAFARRITLEYVLIQGANDSVRDAEALAEMAKPLGAFVNILPLHPGGADSLTPATPAETKRFAGRLRESGVNVTIRRSRGLDISAACGQLRAETDRAASGPSTTVTSRSS
jgi:23S rRNA (adenine2503-C2)-methyltransferase